MNNSSQFTICVATVIIGLFALVAVMSRASCLSGYSEYQPRWGMVSGCRIIHDGKLTPTDIVREVQ